MKVMPRTTAAEAPAVERWKKVEKRRRELIAAKSQWLA